VQAHAATGGEAQEWARAMLGSVGRGGNAQARRARLPDAAAGQRALESVVCMRVHREAAATSASLPRIGAWHADQHVCGTQHARRARAFPGDARPRIAATRTAGSMSDVRPLACAQAQGALLHSCCVSCIGGSAPLVVRPSALTRRAPHARRPGGADGRRAGRARWRPGAAPRPRRPLRAAGARAQAVRDEILNIMHRNHISEKKGSWMEEWHQKLHNNTTPDDVAICAAYIAFLEAGGDARAYWGVLSEHGAPRLSRAPCYSSLLSDRLLVFPCLWVVGLAACYCCRWARGERAAMGREQRSTGKAEGPW